MSARRIAIVGLGRVGANLLRRCALRDLHVLLAADRDADARARAARDFPHLDVREDAAELPAGVDTVILAVPDDAIRDAASALFASAVERPLLVLHTSGLRTAEELASLEGTGAVYGSLHPVQSFPAPDLPDEDLDGIACGIEGGEDFLRAAAALALALGWHAVRVDAGRKPLYHAACVFAGNFPVVCAAAASSLFTTATDERHVPMAALLPMMQTVVRRLLFTPPEEALTGPATRGDLEAVSRHLAALNEHTPQFTDLYRDLTRAALDLGPLDPELRAALRTLLGRDR